MRIRLNYTYVNRIKSKYVGNVDLLARRLKKPGEWYPWVHAYAVTIYFMHYNFVRIHQALKISPAMAIGVTYKLREMSDMVKLLEGGEQSAS